MPSKRESFENNNGQILSAKMELPDHVNPWAFAIFAHCFTCNKNLTAVRNIAKSLNAHGIAVLRFDFTGLGESDGDFAETSFSSNVEDLLEACAFMEREYQAPRLIIGHSLGGAAAIYAASKIKSIEAVATIGAPSSPGHVTHLFEEELDSIKEKGIASVNIGGRPFKVKKQFLDDINGRNMKSKLNNLNKPILILHSPADQIVEVKNATEIYLASRHPKSFISLDSADHLLSEKEDSLYAGSVISSWASRYLPGKPPLDKSTIEGDGVRAVLGKVGFTTKINVRHHHLKADEPLSVGGADLGPNPYELVSSGLAACTVMTLQMYARRKKWDLEEVRVEVEYFKDYARDCEHCEESEAKLDHFHKKLFIKGKLTKDQRTRLLEIAEKCPVNKTLKGVIHMRTDLIEVD